ncbi:A24 family peptidase [Primorskyibacter aestuariivivens]|uniref:prepilin peptidase n=1 Tax=Primorskyibacter aestuariivivens TaxID=1888912 RepID=UPI0023002B4B|nr:A24 family peptidase [Primorskyibacter aestuariivivens]MDA7427620.1 A24 family peptidase [Primorskyibacter aestuariivivens]
MIGILLARCVTLVAAALLLFIAWQDSRHLKIRNQAVLGMLGLYALLALSEGGRWFWTDLLAGAVLFLVGFVMWMMRGMGAGDVKLMLPLGMFVGLQGLGAFSLLLLAVSVVLFGTIKLAQWRQLEVGLGGRIAEMGRSGKVPYAVVLSAAAVPVILWQSFS